MQRLRLATVCTLALAAACQDPPSAPLRPDSPEPPPDLQIASRQYEGMEGYRSPPDAIGSGFIMGRNGEPQRITYAVHGGLAIWEGDIILGPANAIPASRHELVLLAQRRGQPDIAQGVVIDGDGFRWPGGVVPYEIDTALPNQSRVTGAIAMVEEATAGVTLVPRDGEANYVRFTTGDGCSSAIGLQGGRQDIILDTGCSTGNAAHEILHALGMYHEHTRCDRDDFVTINDDQIQEDREHNFTKNCDGATDLDEYDEGSIMHYGPFAFAIGVEPTIESKRGRDGDMGQRAGLGPTDIATINELYEHHNQSPVAVIGPLEDSYPEGSAVMFDGSGSSDPDDAVLFHSWVFGDGTCGASPPLKCMQVSPTHTYVDDALYVVTLTVSDGFLEHVANTTVTVLNVAPIVSAGIDRSVDEGSDYTGSGSFSDPGQDAPWTATVDYGDGAGAEPLALAGKTFNLAHTYVDNLPGDAPYTVTVAVTDKDEGTGTDDLQVTVRNVAPLVSAGADATVTSGETFDFSGTFDDPGVEDDPWDWEIDWGDGETSMGSTDDQSAPITESRQVCLAGEYQVTLSVTDKDGGEGTDDLTLTVPYLTVDIGIMPEGEPTPVNLRSNGVLPVAILSTTTFAATDVDPATVVLGDEAGGDTPVAVHNNGRYRASIEDVNGDGLMDLVLMFDVPALVANGDLTGASTSLVLRGFLDDGCTNFRGEGPVTVRP